MVNWNDIKPDDLEFEERAFNHGIKKEQFKQLFQKPNTIKVKKIKNKGEVKARYLIVGKVHGKYILAISTPTIDKLRIFSGREASDEYKKIYKDC